MSFLRIGAGIVLRSYQKAVMKSFDNGIRYIVLCWSRRAGKSLFAWNLLVREAVSKPGTYWYCFNNYNTAYNDIWIAMTSQGVKFLDMIPADMVVRKNSSKLEIELSNGSIIKLIGIDNADKLVGTGLAGVVFDEYAVLNPASIEFITAMLGETGGWRVMISTPRGKNHFYEEAQFAQEHPEYAYYSNMHCGMPEVARHMKGDFLELERKKIIRKYGNDALWLQEYMTSWVSPNSGSVFGALMKIMKDEGRVTLVEGNDEHPYYTAWDLGNCLDGDNEVLTRKGWVNIKEMPTEIAVWRDGEISYEKVNPFSGYLHEAIHIKGAHIDIKVSPNHKMLIYDNHREREIVAADMKPHYRIVKNGKMAETPVNKWDLLNIMVQADGCLVHPNTNYYRISVKKDRKKQRCRELLEMCGIEYHERDYADGFTKFGFRLPKARDWKRLDWVRSNNQANIDELIRWDGHFVRGNTFVYESTEESCADRVHSMFQLMGYTPFLKKITNRKGSKGSKPLYRVSASIRPKARYTSVKTVERIEFNDYVYCFKTRAGWFMARDKNKHVFVSGNADFTAIILFQVDEQGRPIIIDHIENRNEDVSWYAGEMIERGWSVHTHFLPHDAAHRKGARNESYKSALEKEGITNTVVLKRPNRVEDKLNFLRRVFNGMRINEGLERIVECLDKLEYEWNERLHLWSSTPTHKGGYSDTVDALCYMAQAIQKYRITATNAFSKSKVVGREPLSTTKQAKQERFEEFLKAEFTLGGKKPKKRDNLSMFI